MSAFAVIFPAAGQSSRFHGKEKKPFTNLDGRAVWLRSVEQFINRADVAQCIIVVSPEDQEMFRRRFGANLAFMDIQIANGGRERFESVANALALLKPEVEFVAVHDAVRPCVTESLIAGVFGQAEKTGAAMLAVPVTDTLKQVEPNKQVKATMPRRGLWLAQTPQVFRRDWLEAAYAERAKLGKDITDDAQLIEAAGHAVHVVEGATTNIKITTKQDIILAEAILKALPKPKPSGPAHPFAEEEMWGGRGLK
ncbi:MAG: 2-C-methyl-D-erythritol 4-phosphate cytidylyltransferase [Planctomycetes bacterium]|nr:2-C-methyl-D-erythritol 4-phosphate cytidylyltransferase [Planctomycetota bacterium]